MGNYGIFPIMGNAGFISSTVPELTFLSGPVPRKSVYQAFIQNPTKKSRVLSACISGLLIEPYSK